jgi:hypothetical protein
MTHNASFFKREEGGNPGRDNRHDLVRIGLPNYRSAGLEPSEKRVIGLCKATSPNKLIDAVRYLGEWIGFARFAATLFVQLGEGLDTYLEAGGVPGCEH